MIPLNETQCESNTKHEGITNGGCNGMRTNPNVLTELLAGPPLVGSALDLRLELPPQSQCAPVKLLHLLHAISLAGQVLRHGIALAAI